MARTVAKQQMGTAKRRAGDEGDLILTGIHRTGVYLAIFMNNAHAAEFERFLKSTSVVHVVLTDSLPPGFTVKLPEPVPTVRPATLDEVVAAMERLFGKTPFGDTLRGL